VAKVLRDASCDVGTSCPRIDKVDGGYDIVGTDIPDDTLPEHERKVRVPDTMLPELAVLDIPDFEAWLAERRRAPGDMLRIQTLESYAVASDDGDLAGYLNGAPVPTSKDREPFFQRLREEAAKGMVWRNLTLVNGHPSDYRRYGFEWVCPYSSEAGQQIRVLDVAEHPAAAALYRTGDFWVVEGQHVALVRYSPEGRHLGEVAVEESSAKGYVAAAALAWQLGTAFTEWWAAHPEYRRAYQVA